MTTPQNNDPCPSSSDAAGGALRAVFFGFGSSAALSSSVIGSSNWGSSLAKRLTRVEKLRLEQEEREKAAKAVTTTPGSPKK